MHVYRNSVIEWVVAEDVNGAAMELIQYWKEQDPATEVDDLDLEFEQVPDDKDIRICDDDDKPVTQSAREWVLARGRGFLATTEY